MKIALSLLSALILTAPSLAEAHDPAAFTPVIHNEVSVLCPGQADTLRTQRYDRYQWLVDGQATAGDTLAYFVVRPETHAGHWVQVVGQAWGRSDTSRAMPVQAWQFPELTITPKGSLGRGDTLALAPQGAELSQGPAVLALSLPAATDVQWYCDGLPVAGANGPTLAVSLPGRYQVQAAPAACPARTGFAETQVAVKPLPMPAIRFDLGMLVAEVPEGIRVEAFAWLHNGQLLEGEDGGELQPRQPGYYTLRMDDGRAFTYSEPLLIGGGEAGRSASTENVVRMPVARR